MNENDVITLIHDRLDEPIEIRCGQPTALYVENADEFYRLVGELLSQYSGGASFRCSVTASRRL